MISRRDFLEKMALVPFTFMLPKSIWGTRNHEQNEFINLSLNQRNMQVSYDLPYLELHKNGELKKGEKHCGTEWKNVIYVHETAMPAA